MKIGGRNGHNPLATGANALVNEVKEDTKIFDFSKKFLETKHQFIDCYPGRMYGVNAELIWGIDKANDKANKGRNKVDFFYSVHLNKAYNRYNGAIGSEIWLYPECSEATKQKAIRILENLERLGFKNRGIKYSNNLAELNSTNMEAMIIECFFCESTEDVKVYKNVGAEALGFAIANGIDPSITKLQETEIKTYRNVLVYAKGNNVDKSIAECFSWYLDDSIVIDHTQINTVKGISVYSIGALTGVKCDIAIRGKDRKDTLEKALARVGIKR